MKVDARRGDSPALSRALADCVPWLLVYAFLVTLFLGLAATGFDVLDLFRDPAEFPRLRLPLWEGSLSLLGYMAWNAAATACLLTAVAVRERRGRGRGGFLAATGSLALVLGFVDAFLLQERFADRFGGPGASGLVVLVPYVLAALAWALLYRREILASRLGLALAAGMGFAGSLALEFWPFTVELPRAKLIEEVLELGGLAMFAIYCVSESYRELVSDP